MFEFQMYTYSVGGRPAATRILWSGSAKRRAMHGHRDRHVHAMQLKAPAYSSPYASEELTLSSQGCYLSFSALWDETTDVVDKTIFQMRYRIDAGFPKISSWNKQTNTIKIHVVKKKMRVHDNVLDFWMNTHNRLHNTTRLESYCFLQGH